MNICTYNTRTINDLNPESLNIMLRELQYINWDIVGFSETKCKENNITTVDKTGHRLFLSGNETSRSNGVGFLVKKKLIPLVNDYKAISDRLAVLTLKTKFCNITLIQCYFPTSITPDESILALYDEIELIIQAIPKRDYLYIMGDFNCKVGGLHINYPDAVGKYTTGLNNNRGILLAEFCTRNNLTITNTHFQKRNYYTWTSPDGNTKNQIDFILSRKNSYRHNILDSTALNYPDISDHRLVRVRTRLNFSWPKKAPSKPKLDLQPLQNEAKETFQLILSNRFQTLSEISDPNDINNKIIDGLLDTVKEVLPKLNNDKPDWMSEEAKQAITSKHICRKEKGTKSCEYKSAKAKSKMLVKRDQILHVEKDLDEIASLPPYKQFYAAIKRLKTKPKHISWGINDKNNEILTNKVDIMERWAEFYDELYRDNPSEVNIDDSEEDEIPPITQGEVRKAIEDLKIGKSPGLDNIYSEYIKAGGEPLINAFTYLFRQIQKTGTIPQKFKDALIVVIYKKNSKLECGNYRPISLLSHIYKVFISIIATRVKNDLYASFPDSQAAYQPGRGTIEQIFSLEQIIEKALEFNNPVYIAFIDFTKAFDSIKLDCLWNLLEKTSINKRYIRLLKSTYNNSTASIKTDIGISKPVNILKGVKQGDVLSAILFCIVIASIIIKAEDCGTGYTIGGRILSNLTYADDITLMNKSERELQHFLDCLVKYSSEVGLFINVSKTECMTTAKDTTLNLTIDGKPIKQVYEFVYLGHKIAANNNGAAAVKYRIGLGWASFEKHKPLLNSRRIPYHIKTKIYNTYILPVVLYGLECVNWTVKLQKSLETFQNHIMRFITNHKLTDHIKIKDLYRITKLTPISKIIRSRCIKLYGHIKRSDKGLSKLCLEGMVEGKHKRGKPAQRWRDNIYTWTKSNLDKLNNAPWMKTNTDKLNTVSKCRDQWKKLSHINAQSAVGGDSEQ